MYTSLIRHDIGNDLQIITSALGISRLNLSDSIDEEYLKIITAGDAAITRMTNLLKALSNPSEWSEGKIEQFFSRIISNAKEVHHEMKFKLNVTEEMQTCSITTSRLLPMVFENLIRNSSVYAGPNSQISIDVSKEGDMCKIVFVDDGPDIPLSIRDKTFKKGVSTTGGGMGLYLSKQICKACGGSISHSPSQDGRGAEFIIMMPIV
jgi:signal transduction histidine kinase